MDAFHTFLAGAQKAEPSPKARPPKARPPKAPPPAPAAPAPETAPKDPPHAALLRLWRAEWLAERAHAAANPAPNPTADAEFAALATRLNRMAERLRNPPEAPTEGPAEEEYQTPLPPPDSIGPRARHAVPKDPTPEGAQIIYDENRPPVPPVRLPKITAKGKEVLKGRAGAQRSRWRKR